MIPDVNMERYVVHILKDDEELEYVDLDDNPGQAATKGFDDISYAIDELDAENYCMTKITQEKRSQVLTRLFGPGNPNVNKGAILLLDRSCVYFKNGFKTDFFKDRYSTFKKAAEGLTLDEFSSFSQKVYDIRRSLNTSCAFMIIYDEDLLDFDSFIKYIDEEEEYYIGHVFAYDCKF